MGEAVFTQITAAVNTLRDAVRFQNGSEVLLQRFAEGQRVRVLTLASAEERATGPKQQQRVTIQTAKTMASSVRITPRRRMSPFCSSCLRRGTIVELFGDLVVNL
jgi:hypothetical protein